MLILLISQVPVAAVLHADIKESLSDHWQAVHCADIQHLQLLQQCSFGTCHSPSVASHVQRQHASRALMQISCWAHPNHQPDGVLRGMYDDHIYMMMQCTHFVA